MAIGAFKLISAGLSFLNGGAFKSLSEAYSSTVKARSDAATRQVVAGTEAERAIEIKQLDFQIAAIQAQARIMLAEQGWWVTRWIRPCFAYASLFHYVLVILASSGAIAGPIHALPAPMDWLELGIIGSYFALRPFEKRKRAALLEMIKP